MRRVLLLAGAAVALVAAAVGASAVADQPHRYYRSAVVVDASRASIWSLLTELDRYEEWNPYITRASGRARVGATLELTLEPSGETTETHEATVLIVRIQRKLEWETRLVGPLPGVLDHEQIFRVLPLDGNRWRVVSEARFEGLLAPFADVDGERAGLARMLEALAREAPRYQSSSE